MTKNNKEDCKKCLDDSSKNNPPSGDTLLLSILSSIFANTLQTVVMWAKDRILQFTKSDSK